MFTPLLLSIYLLTGSGVVVCGTTITRQSVRGSKLEQSTTLLVMLVKAKCIYISFRCCTDVVKLLKDLGEKTF